MGIDKTGSYVFAGDVVFGLALVIPHSDDRSAAHSNIGAEQLAGKDVYHSAVFEHGLSLPFPAGRGYLLLHIHHNRPP